MSNNRIISSRWQAENIASIPPCAPGAASSRAAGGTFSSTGRMVETGPPSAAVTACPCRERARAAATRRVARRAGGRRGLAMLSTDEAQLPHRRCRDGGLSQVARRQGIGHTGAPTLKENHIVRNFAGQTVAEILQRKKASIKQAPLPSGSPDWTSLSAMTWEQIDEGARTNRLGFKAVRKLLTDQRFDK